MPMQGRGVRVGCPQQALGEHFGGSESCSWVLLQCSKSVLQPAHFPIFGSQLGLEPETYHLPARYCVLSMLGFHQHLLCLFNQSTTSSLWRIHLQENSAWFAYSFLFFFFFPSQWYVIVGTHTWFLWVQLACKREHVGFCACRGWRGITFDLDNKRRKTISVNFSLTAATTEAQQVDFC